MTVTEDLARLLGWVARVGLEIQVSCARVCGSQVGLGEHIDVAWLGGVLFQLRPLAGAVGTGDYLGALAACATVEQALRQRRQERMCAEPNRSGAMVAADSVDEGLEIIAALSERLADCVIGYSTRRSRSVPRLTNYTQDALRTA